MCLTTHILDLSVGKPAAGVKMKLYFLDSVSDQWQCISTRITNADGRCDSPLLTEKEIKVGTYELLFFIGDYFRNQDLSLPNPPFLEQIPIRFGIANQDSHYHVPLLVSPWGYQVYRGS